MGRMGIGNAFLATLVSLGKAVFVFQIVALKRQFSAGGTRVNYDPLVRAHAARNCVFNMQISSPCRTFLKIRWGAKINSQTILKNWIEASTSLNQIH